MTLNEPMTLKSRYFTKLRSSVLQTICNLAKRYEHYCGVNNRNFIKLTIFEMKTL
jgi:hypothetical protein